LKTKGLRYVVVVLEDAPSLPKVKKARSVLVDQRNMVYLPRVVAVQHGQAVRFENNDLYNHSVMAASPVKENQFNAFVVQGRPLERFFVAHKNPIQIGCSLHPWMRAWVFVLPHPWFAVTDEKGRFKMERVPPGKHTILLKHPDTGLQERRSVEVEGDKNTAVNVEWRKVGS
jgi:plastocyanin